MSKDQIAVNKLVTVNAALWYSYLSDPQVALDKIVDTKKVQAAVAVFIPR